MANQEQEKLRLKINAWLQILSGLTDDERKTLENKKNKFMKENVYKGDELLCSIAAFLVGIYQEDTRICDEPKGDLCH